MKPQAPAIHIQVPILQALPKGGLPFKVSLPQSSTLPGGRGETPLWQTDHFKGFKNKCLLQNRQLPRRLFLDINQSFGPKNPKCMGPSGIGHA
jgi:hypothetical protein